MKYKKGSTLIEVIVAMLIQVIIVSLIFSFIVNTRKKTNTTYKIEAFLLLDNEIQHTIKNKDYTNSTINYETFRIQKRLIVDDYSENTITINFRIEDFKDSVLLERNRIFVLNDTLIY